MKIYAKSSSYLKAKDVENYLKSACPIRLFKRVNLVDTDDGLSFSYRIPSKSKINIDFTSPVTQEFYQYLIDNEMKINHIGECQWMVDSVRGLRDQANTALKDFCRTLSAEDTPRFTKRICTLQDSINKECIPHVTRVCLHEWDAMREKAFKKMKYHEL